MHRINKRTPWMALALLAVYAVGNYVVEIVVSLPFYTSRAAEIQASAARGTKPGFDDLVLLSIPKLVSAALVLLFCIYVLDWFFKTGRELAGEMTERYNAALWMFLGMVLGAPMIYVWYKTSKLAADYSESGSLIKNLLLLLIFPVGIFVIQRDINSRTAFEEMQKGPSYGILTRFGFLGMEYWWLLLAFAAYIIGFVVLEANPDIINLKIA